MELILFFLSDFEEYLKVGQRVHSFYGFLVFSLTYFAAFSFSTLRKPWAGASRSGVSNKRLRSNEERICDWTAGRRACSSSPRRERLLQMRKNSCVEDCNAWRKATSLVVSYVVIKISSVFAFLITLKWFISSN